jgi:hypothetical protein
MKDKDLFEKVEKAFELEDNQIVNEVFNNGKFKKMLNEIRTPSGGSENLLGQIGSAVKYLSPTQIRQREADAQLAELEVARRRRQMMKADSDDDTEEKKDGSEFTKWINQPENAEFKKVYMDVVKSGVPAKQLYATNKEKLNVYEQGMDAWREISGRTPVKKASKKLLQTAAIKDVIDNEITVELRTMLSKLMMLNDYARAIIAGKDSATHGKAFVKPEHTDRYKNKEEYYAQLRDVLQKYILATRPSLLDTRRSFDEGMPYVNDILPLGVPKKFRDEIVDHLRRVASEQSSLPLDGK